MTRRYFDGARAALRQLLLGYKQIRLSDNESAQERQRAERLKEKDRRLALQTQSAAQRGTQDKARRKRRPSVGEVRFGDLRRLSPISRDYGLDRGRPIDRYYIEKFLAGHADDIRGRVLEIKDSAYTRKFGSERVNVSDVLDIEEDNPHATIVADLTSADHVPSDTFDCIIFTQTLHVIYDLNAAVQTLQRILKPGGILLATFPGISKTSCARRDHYFYWALTTLSARRLFAEAFPAENVEIEAHGNVLAVIAFMQGLAVRDLRRRELDHQDPDYELLITLRAVKPNEGS
jgi:SAM-dependent methyltransferase